MKTKLFLSMIAAFLLVFFAFCDDPDQKPGNGPKGSDVEAAAALIYNPSEDTIITAASTDQITFALGTYYSSRTYAWQVSADSLSGGTACTCTLQYNADMGSSDWANLASVTIDGVSTRSVSTGTFQRGIVRAVCSAGTSTQQTAIRVDLASE